MKLSNSNINQLPPFLHEVAIGQLLGDASCSRAFLTHNSRLEWSFGKNRMDYAQFISNLFIDYLGTGLSSLLVSSNKTNEEEISKSKTSFRLKTLSLPLFNVYREMFYVFDPDTNKYIKIIPLHIETWLTPVVLAHLTMGDGNFQPKVNTIRIYTNTFTKTELVLFASVVESKFGIKIGVRHDRNNQYILAIGARELLKYQNLVAPHFHSSMLYRIGL